MFLHIILLLTISNVLGERACYYNSHCPYQLYSTKTPYDSIRGDIRDYPDPQNCEAVSVWSLNRHGNRNPGSSVTESIKVIAGLKNEIIASHEAGTSQLCSQDIEDFRRWSWNETLEVSHAFLTGTGYEELYDIGKRIRERYPHLLHGSNSNYYFRTTNEQRTITSSMAFVHGLTENTNLNLSIDGPWERDDIIRPYENCDKYQEESKGGKELEEQLEAYFKTADFVAVQNSVQERLGIRTVLTPDNIYSFYEICRFYRSWTPNLRSPWCSVFTDDDLVVLEYRDDVRHYYRNGYGTSVNTKLGGPVLKDLYDNFEAAVNGRGRDIVSYFTHDTMIEMAICSMGIFKDDFKLEATNRVANRKWMTSYISPFSVNIMAILNRCNTSGTESHRVQFFFNEKESEICPFEGCTWQEFEDKFSSFTSSLDFCSLNYVEPAPPSLPDSAAVNGKLEIAVQDV
ncbi:multiple inositol polyphosphate phosphatase 1 [Aphomia sociella]